MMEIFEKSGLNDRHQARWVSAQNLFHDMLDVAKREAGFIMFDQTILQPSQIEIDADGIRVRIDNCTYIMFEPDASLDHGLYDTVTKFARDIRARFSVVRKLRF